MLMMMIIINKIKQNDDDDGTWNIISDTWTNYFISCQLAVYVYVVESKRQVWDFEVFHAYQHNHIIKSGVECKKGRGVRR